MNVQSPAHTCVDRPHLPCDACAIGSNLVDKLKPVIDEATKAIARIAFRMGVRAALITFAVGGGHVCPDSRIDELGKSILGEDYYR
jgi:hypothetical protein